MEALVKTSAHGATITLTPHAPSGVAVITANDPRSPEEFRDCEIGIIVAGGFIPNPDNPGWSLGPHTLRTLADLIDEYEEEVLTARAVADMEAGKVVEFTVGAREAALIRQGQVTGFSIGGDDFPEEPEEERE